MIAARMRWCLMLLALVAVPLLPGSVHGHPAVLYAQEQPAKSSALELAAPALADCQYPLARFARLGPLCGSQRVQNSRNQPPGGPRGWTFDEKDEDAPRWTDDVRAQAFDIGMVVAFSALAFASFFRKSVALKYVTLVAAVGYLGFYKSQLISVVNILGLLGGNLPIFRYNLAWYLLAAITVVSTVLWGRVYCGRICAFGAFTQLLDQVVPKRLRVTVPRAIERRASMIKYGILAGAIAYFLLTRDALFYPYIEPFWMFGVFGKSPVLWAGLGVLLVATLFVRNLYCRFLCPLGAALGLLSKLTVFRIKRWSECSTCRICEKACEWGAIRGPQIVLTECVRCDDCERLYADTKKCPHHRIIFYRSRLAAQRANM